MKKYLDLKNKIDYTKIKEPAKIIKKGGIVIFPTETVYGIGANGLDEKAVKKLYDIKQRPLNKPISLLVSDMNMVNEIAQDMEDFEGKVDYFIDGGDSKLGIASTIVKVVDGIPYILRQGTITKEQIEEIAGKVILKCE